LDHTNGRKRTDANDTNFPEVLAKLVKLAPERSKPNRAVLFVNRRSISLFQYYTQLHPTVMRRVGKSVLRRFTVTKVPKEREPERIDEQAPPAPQHAWFVTDQTDRQVADLRADLPNFELEERYKSDDHRILEVTRLPVNPAAAAAAPAVPAPASTAPEVPAAPDP
ncbi:MAG TPA: hypothetical protein VGQ57_14985, partial [Polyangiaceae bacterium]|nr:hypothetical protein [Polyangiaceae bacterium]